MKNKGFSLVELIVVVLILGIISVALAPQVMKWVGTSRENSDTYVAKSIKAAALTAVAEYESLGNTLHDGKYNVTHAGLTAVGTDSNPGLTTVLSTVMNGEYPEVQHQVDKVFQIQFWQSGKKVEVVITSGTY